MNSFHSRTCLTLNSAIEAVFNNGAAVGTTNSTPSSVAGTFAVAVRPSDTTKDLFNGYVDELRLFTFTAGQFSTNDLLINAGPPAVANLAPGNITANKATLNGTVNPSGLKTTYYFQYGTSTTYSSSSTSGTLPVSSTDTPVSVSVVNLAPATLYHFRIVAYNDSDLSIASDSTFITSNAPPTAATQPATSLTSTSATLNALINPSNSTTRDYFQYGLTTNYGLFSATNNLAVANVPLATSNLITGLRPATTYHFRIVASNIAGSATGGDLTFATSSSSPSVTTLAATGITTSNALLNATISPNGLATSAWFQFDTNLFMVILNPSFESNRFNVFPGYGSVNGGGITGWTMSDPRLIGLNPSNGSPFANNGATPDGTNVAFIQSINNTNSTLSTTLSNLVVGYAYTVGFRANSRSSYGTPNATWSLNGGSFVPFTASPPVGGTNPYYTNWGSFTATNNTAAMALRNSTAADSTVLLDEFSVSTPPTSTSSLTNLPATNTDLSVSIPIGGLQPATTYHFRIVATNSDGTATGTDMAFTTLLPASPVLMGVTTLTNGTFQFNFTNIPGAHFTVFGTTNISLPFSNWTILSNLVEGPAGTFTFTDPQATTNGQRFYRVRFP